MADPLRDRSAGDKYPTGQETLNAMLGAARDHKRRGMKQRPGIRVDKPKKIVMVNKSATTDIARFSIVKIGAALNSNDLYKANHVFQIESPDANSFAQDLAIIQKTAKKDGGAVEAITSGFSLAKISGTPAARSFLWPDSANVNSLKQTGGPTSIRLWNLPGGESIGKVFIDQFPFCEFWAKITSRTSNGANKWLYSFQAVDNSNVTGQAINAVESNNTGQDEEGNGWWLQTGDELLPIGIGCIVLIRRRSNGQFWFQQANLVKPCIKTSCLCGSGSGSGSGSSAPYCSDSHPSSLSDDFSGAVNWTVGSDVTVANTSGEMVLTEVTSGGFEGTAFSPHLSAGSDPASLVAEIELRQVPSDHCWFDINHLQLGLLTDMNVFVYATDTTYFVGGFAPGTGTPILGTGLPLISPTVGDVWRLEFTITNETDISAVTKINGTTHATRTSRTIAALAHCGIKARCGVKGNVKFDNFSATY